MLIIEKLSKMASEIASLLPDTLRRNAEQIARNKIMDEDDAIFRSAPRSRSFMEEGLREGPQRKQQLIATMPSIQKEVEQDIRRSRSVDLSAPSSSELSSASH